MADVFLPLDHYAVLFSAPITNEEWDDRVALNAALLSQSRSDFEKSQRATLSKDLGPWVRDERLRKIRLDRRMATFDAAMVDPTAAADKFNVRYVALSADAPLAAYLKSGWRTAATSPRWVVWSRVDGKW